VQVDYGGLLAFGHRTGLQRTDITVFCSNLPPFLITSSFQLYAVASKNQEEERNLLTMTNIKYLVEGLDALLMTDLDGEKRRKVIQLRNELLSHINSIFSDYS
jgi:hypothetical protein